MTEPEGTVPRDDPEPMTERIPTVPLSEPASEAEQATKAEPATQAEQATEAEQATQAEPATEAAPASAPNPDGAERQTVYAEDEKREVNLGRIAWIVTVAACLVAVLILVLQGYYGYAVVTFAVAASAAINLK